jgi:hypothetical protein
VSSRVGKGSGKLRMRLNRRQLLVACRSFPGSLAHRCSAGLVVNCTVDFYNPLEGQTDATACVRCPRNSHTLFERSTSVSDCLCDGDFYDSNASHAAVECVACPVGTECNGGSSLEELPLRKGYYRLDPTSVDVRVCPDAQINCSSTFGTSACDSTSGCQGGMGFPCANNLTGVYCRLCNRSNDAIRVFYKAATADEVAKCEICSDVLVRLVIILAAVLTSAALVLTTVLWVGRRQSSRSVHCLKRFVTIHTPVIKFKIIFALPDRHTDPSRL